MSSELPTSNERTLHALGAMFGRKVQTPAGEGILIEVTMPHNGLYYEPERADLLVWYGGGGTGWSWRTWNLTEVRLSESGDEKGCSECQRLRDGLALIATDEHRLMNVTARQTAASILAGKPAHSSEKTSVPLDREGWMCTCGTWNEPTTPFACVHCGARPGDTRSAPLTSDEEESLRERADLRHRPAEY
jgi:hypothetical protein